MISVKRAGMEAQLPATPCTDEMRKRIVGIAKSQGVSIAQVQRVAYEFFLAQIDSNANNSENSAKLEQTS